MIIAIDGPAASGKGTLARRLAAHLGLPHLDTGLLYRATARVLIDRGHDLSDQTAAVVAAIPDVRAALVETQRGFARRPGGAVLDGRDIGTVICPEAASKIFVTASDEARATRRALELRARGEAVDYAAVLEDIRQRDRRDSHRAAAPLKPASDAVVLDTTKLDVDAAFKAALAIVEADFARRRAQTAV